MRVFASKVCHIKDTSKRFIHFPKRIITNKLFIVHDARQCAGTDTNLFGEFSLTADQVLSIDIVNGNLKEFILQIFVYLTHFDLYFN